jgi:hypothetical protein
LLPYLAAAGIAYAVASGRISNELALVLAGCLALPSPVQHAFGALTKKGPPADE